MKILVLALNSSNVSYIPYLDNSQVGLQKGGLNCYIFQQHVPVPLLYFNLVQIEKAY